MTTAPTAPHVTDAGAAMEPYRVELTGYCYRMLGSAFDAEDAVQETLVRAWRAYDRFDGRSSLRTWLYRIATNVCIDSARATSRRARPMDLASPSGADDLLPGPLPEAAWIGPMPDARALPAGLDPAEQVAARESVKLAFVATLQHLPARQRATLILRDVLRWSAAEVAELLGTSVPAVNSALQRAHATMQERGDRNETRTSDDAGQPALLTRYVKAFERFDLEALTALLHLDVTLSLPPYATWLQGSADLRRWWAGQGNGCQGSMLCRVSANGAAAFGQYRPGGRPWALQVVDTSDGRITAITSFLDTERLFPLFGLPPRAEPASVP